MAKRKNKASSLSNEGVGVFHEEVKKVDHGEDMGKEEKNNDPNLISNVDPIQNIEEESSYWLVHPMNDDILVNGKTAKRILGMEKNGGWSLGDQVK